MLDTANHKARHCLVDCLNLLTAFSSDNICILQRVTQICRILGKSEDVIQKKLNGGVSMESLDNLKETEDNIMEEKSEKIPINGNCDIKPEQSSKDTGDLIDIRSDNESGFDESSSQMSKSGHGDLNTVRTGIETGSLSLDSSVCSVGRDQLSLDLLVLEMSSVAIDWKSFRNIHNCSCASPFNSFTKKARQYYIPIFMQTSQYIYLQTLAV